MAARSDAEQEPKGGTTTRAIVALLSPAVGRERSEEAVAQAARVLQLQEQLTAGEAFSILDLLSRSPGMIGVTARYAQSRANFSGRMSRPPPSPTPPEDDEPPPSVTRPNLRSLPPTAPTLAIEEVIGLLAQTIGLEKSDQIVRACARRLLLREGRLDQAQVTKLVEMLAEQGGIVGITARFAKARLILRFTR